MKKGHKPSKQHAYNSCANASLCAHAIFVAVQGLAPMLTQVLTRLWQCSSLLCAPNHEHSVMITPQSQRNALRVKRLWFCLCCTQLKSGCMVR